MFRTKLDRVAVIHRKGQWLVVQDAIIIEALCLDDSHPHSFSIRSIAIEAQFNDCTGRYRQSLLNWRYEKRVWMSVILFVAVREINGWIICTVHVCTSLWFPPFYFGGNAF